MYFSLAMFTALASIEKTGHHTTGVTLLPQVPCSVRGTRELKE